MALALAAAMSPAATPQAEPAAPAKVLHLSFAAAENGFDPARIDDLYSHNVTVHVFESLYAYLNNDVSRRRASIGLALDLCGAALGAGANRRHLNPSSPLVTGGLLLVEETDRPYLSRPLRVPDRVASHLLGDDTVDPAVEPLVGTSVEADVAGAGLLQRSLGLGLRLCYLRERTGTAGQSLAATADPKTLELLTTPLALTQVPLRALTIARLEPPIDH